MRIKKIMKVQNFGQYNDFNWPSKLYEFKKYNFFYGWNYSGKTTLSRILRCFEKKQLHNDYQNAAFSLELEENQNLTEKNIDNDYPIRVFNEDFIEDNFDWNNENAEIDPVLILGEESKELDKQLKQKQKEKEKIEKQKNDKENERSQKERDLQNKLTTKASEIRNILSITNPREFDKNALEQKIDQIKDNISEKILPDDELNKLRNFISSQKLDLINLSSTSIDLKLDQFVIDIKTILNSKVSAQKIIEKLNQNMRLSQWVKEGIDLHKDENTCQFCGNPLTKERLEELNKHFSKEFDMLMDTINKKENELKNHIDYISKFPFPDKAKLYNEFQHNYENLLERFSEIKTKYIDTIESLKEELLRKKEKPFESIAFDQSITTDIENEINNIFVKIKSIINQHNGKVNSLDDEKEIAKEKIKLHYCAKFINDENYFVEMTSIKQLKEEILKLQNQINNITIETKDIENKISALAIGADRINDYLNKFFGDDRLKIEQTPNGKYKLYRNDKIAKNLSTGERNIISLMYFFAKLEETNFDLGNAIIFIDDPVSSLDANHMHRFYSFLNEKIKNIGQLFITTHNFDFFNLIKDLSKYDLPNNEGKFYLIKRIKSGEKCCSTIEKLPTLLLIFKSEYNYLFYLLKNFNESNDKGNFDQLYLIPNILRRFFELYLFMKYPDGKKFKDKAKKFFEGTSEITEKNFVFKIMDEYSHEENPEHSMRFPDIQELTNAVECVLKSLNIKDKEHYDALCESLKSMDA
jgi:wobble nucleotide-excising tRNase